MPAPLPASHGAAMEFVTFTTAGQSYCLEITQIREIRRWVSVTALPHAPADVLGVMNLRGTVIPIIDLAVRFGLGRTELNARNVVIIVAFGGQTLGLMVEAVSEILTVRDDQIRETPQIQSHVTRQSIQGLIATEGDMTRIIDLNAIFDVHDDVCL